MALALWTMLKIAAVALLAALVVKELIGLLFGMRGLRAVIEVGAMQYLTATLSSVFALYLAPVYVAANPSMTWMQPAVVVLMFVFSALLESMLYSAKETVEKSWTFAIASNLAWFAACAGLGVVGLLPTIW